MQNSFIPTNNKTKNTTKNFHLPHKPKQKSADISQLSSVSNKKPTIKACLITPKKNCKLKKIFKLFFKNGLKWLKLLC